ncbi:alpha-(1,3)-fucosyltransferase 4 [Hyalella azteca]|uniref:Fucosyltransferase n=1 Tax=Hyalella azteca TaxID=294128 RepID=A0A8B7N966_HYAAZ|nr:alpha-(1,3)-fucosyltransferase 4 [Hyalella azteca]
MCGGSRYFASCLLSCRYNVVPVVYGLGPYEAVAPPGSYIDALAFPSARDLAQHLLYLSRNTSAYLAHFRWRDSYSWSMDHHVSWCALCEKLHSQHEPRKTYDIYDWFMRDKCVGTHDPRVRTLLGD